MLQAYYYILISVAVMLALIPVAVYIAYSIKNKRLDKKMEELARMRARYYECRE